ncbi:MAG: hypothetical protein ACLFQG_01295 [Desulfovermiculus sp.]
MINQAESEIFSRILMDIFWQSFEISFRSPCAIPGTYGFFMEGVHSSREKAASRFAHFSGRQYPLELIEQRTLIPCFPGYELFLAALNSSPLSLSPVSWQLNCVEAPSPFRVWFVYN